MSQQEELPVKSPENFIAEVEVMDLSKLKDKTYLVGVNTGPRDKPKLLCATLHGPYDFYEMVEEVGIMWRDNQHHAKVYICEKNRDKRPQFLDECTVDYLEANYKDILAEGLLDGAFDLDKKFTCQANVLTTEEEANKE